MDQIVYGIHPVEEALRSTHLQFQKILIGADKIHSHLQSVLDLAARRRVPIVHSTGQALDQMTKGALHQNIVGIINGIAYKSVEEILSRWKKEGTKALLIILDGIQDPQNLGSLIRTASGCGAHGMIIPRDRAAGITPAVIKASAGAAAYFPVARVVNLSTVIEKLKKEGLWVYGAAGEAGGQVRFRTRIRFRAGLRLRPRNPQPPRHDRSGAGAEAGRRPQLSGHSSIGRPKYSKRPRHGSQRRAWSRQERT